MKKSTIITQINIQIKHHKNELKEVELKTDLVFEVWRRQDLKINITPEQLDNIFKMVCFYQQLMRLLKDYGTNKGD